MSSDLKVPRSVFEGPHHEPVPKSPKPENDSPKTKETHYMWNDKSEVGHTSNSDLTGLKISPKRRSRTSTSSQGSSISSKSSVYDRLYTKPTHSAQVRLQEKMKWEWGPHSPLPAENQKTKITISSSAYHAEQDRRKSAPGSEPVHSPVRQQEKRKSAPYSEKENAVFDRLYKKKTESVAVRHQTLHKKEGDDKAHKDEKAHKPHDDVVKPVFDRLYSQSTQSSSLRTSSTSFKLEDDEHHHKSEHGTDMAVNPVFDRLYATKTEAFAVREHELHAKAEEEHHFNNRKPEVVNPVFDRLYAQKTESFAVREQQITHAKEEDLHHISHHKNSVVTPVFHRLYAHAQDMEMRKAAARARPPSPPPKHRIKVVLRQKSRPVDPDMLDDRKPAAIDMKKEVPDSKPAAIDMDQSNGASLPLNMPGPQPAAATINVDNNSASLALGKPDLPVDVVEENDGSLHQDISESNPDVVDVDKENGELRSSQEEPKESAADRELKLEKQKVRLSEADSTQLRQPPHPSKLFLSQRSSLDQSMSTEDKDEYLVQPPRLSALHSMSTEDKEHFLLQATSSSLEATISTEDIVSVEPRRQQRTQVDHSERPGAYSVDMAGRTVVVTANNRFDVSVVLENDDSSIEEGVVDQDNSEATLAIHLEAVPVDDSNDNSRVRDLEMQMSREIARRQALERRMELKDRQIKKGIPILIAGLLIFAGIVIGVYFLILKE